MPISDKSISRFEDDRLERKALIERMVPALVRGEGAQRKATEVVLGLTGPWGSGKSTMLNLLAEHLGSLGNVFVVPFNPWLIGSRDDLLLALLDEMQISLGGHDKAAMREVVGAIAKYRKSLAPLLKFVPVVGNAAAEAIKEWSDPEPRSPAKAREEVHNALKALQGAVVVLIDEFDRLEPSEMKAMGQAIKAAMDLPNISWVVALDSDRVVSTLSGEDKDWALGFVAKVITINIPVRPLTDEDKVRLLEKFLKDAGVESPILQSDLYPKLRDLLLPLLATPRDIKRTVATYATMAQMVGWAVFSCDILAWSALGTMQPALQRQVSQKVRLLCVGADPVSDEIEEALPEGQGAENLERLFELDRHGPLFRLINFMFPQDMRFDIFRYGRVQFYGNAWNLLWLGDGPLNWSLDQIRRFWNDPETFLDGEPDGRQNSDLLEATFQRLPDLDPTGDLPFFRFAIRKCESAPAFDRSLTDHFLRQLNRSAALRRRMRAVFEGLRADNDLVLVPLLLRSQAWRHGLRGFKPNPEQPEFLTAAEVDTILQEETPKWRDWMRAGEWQRQTHVHGPLEAFVELSDITEADRENFMNQIADPSVLSAFARVFVGHYQAFGRVLLKRLTNPGSLLERLDSAVSASKGQNQDELIALRIIVDNVIRKARGENHDRVEAPEA